MLCCVLMYVIYIFLDGRHCVIHSFIPCGSRSRSRSRSFSFYFNTHIRWSCFCIHSYFSYTTTLEKQKQKTKSQVKTFVSVSTLKKNFKRITRSPTLPVFVVGMNNRPVTWSWTEQPMNCRWSIPRMSWDPVISREPSWPPHKPLLLIQSSRRDSLVVMTKR